MQFWLSFKMPGLLELHYTTLFSILNEVSVKTLIEQCKALGDISEKELSNKNASLTYRASTNTISTWVKNKEN